MSTLVFVATPGTITPPPTFQPWTTMVHTWTGFNGDMWDLTGDDTSGVWLNSGLRGVGTPAYTDYWREGTTDGASWQGAIASKRTVFWPITVFQDGSSADWIDYDRRLWRTFRRGYPGTWSVTNPATAETRTLSLRVQDDGDWAPDIDPSLVGYATYGVTFIAEQPYWVGETITGQWGQAESPVNFFGGGSVSSAGAGPPFHIRRGSSINTATVSNPGDVDAYPIWTVVGPSTAATVGLGGQTIEIPSALSAGQWVQIDTLKQSALWGSGWVDDTGTSVAYTAPNAAPDPSMGVRRVPDGLGQVGFAKVPSGQFLPLSITMTGTGYVRMDLTPLYERAW